MRWGVALETDLGSMFGEEVETEKDGKRARLIRWGCLGEFGPQTQWAVQEWRRSDFDPRVNSTNQTGCAQPRQEFRRPRAW
jgi:hypothetical protein